MKSMLWHLITTPISTEADIGFVRQLCRSIAGSLGSSVLD
jgi:hypothetical protein